MVIDVLLSRKSGERKQLYSCLSLSFINCAVKYNNRYFHYSHSLNAVVINS